MPEWSELMGGKLFITDLGENRTSVINNTETIIGRYAVWCPTPNSNQHRIIEVGDNLEVLMQKYNIPNDMICRIK